MKIKLLILVSCVLALNTASAQGWRLYKNVCTDAATATGCTETKIHNGEDWLNGANITPRGDWITIATTEPGTGGAIKACPTNEVQGKIPPCITFDTWSSSDPQNAAFDDNGNGIVVTGKKGETAVGFYKNWKYIDRIRGWDMPFTNAYITKSGRYIYATTSLGRIYKFDVNKIADGKFDTSYSRIYDLKNCTGDYCPKFLNALALDDDGRGYVTTNNYDQLFHTGLTKLYKFENGKHEKLDNSNINNFLISSEINSKGLDMDSMNNLLIVGDIQTQTGGEAYYLSPLNTHLQPGWAFEYYGYTPMSVMYGKFNTIFVAATDGIHSKR